MDSKEKENNIELLNVAIKRLIQETKDEDEDKDDHHQPLLSRLLSQVESLKHEQTQSSEGSSGGGDIIEKEEIVKELKEVKRQNSITHCLLSALIVLIVAWQVSEVSLFLKLKGVSDGLTHPFKSLGGFFTNIFKRRLANADDTQQDDSNGISLPHPPPHHLRIPHLEFPDLGGNGQGGSE